jgi:hypothetical protein
MRVRAPTIAAASRVPFGPETETPETRDDVVKDVLELDGPVAELAHETSELMTLTGIEHGSLDVRQQQESKAGVRRPVRQAAPEQLL